MDFRCTDCDLHYHRSITSILPWLRDCRCHDIWHLSHSALDHLGVAGIRLINSTKYKYVRINLTYFHIYLHIFAFCHKILHICSYLSLSNVIYCFQYFFLISIYLPVVRGTYHNRGNVILSLSNHNVSTCTYIHDQSGIRDIMRYDISVCLSYDCVSFRNVSCRFFC